jgi:hypothetical protein
MNFFSSSFSSCSFSSSSPSPFPSPSSSSLSSSSSFSFPAPSSSFYSPSPSSSSSFSSTSSAPSALPPPSAKFGYGRNPQCSPLQQQWQTSHPMFLAIKKDKTVRDVVQSNAWANTIADPSILLPPASPALWYDKPELIHYVQLPLYLWVPEFFLPQFVKFMPCPEKGCEGRTSRQRWHSGGPLLVHGMQSAVYLHCWEYECQMHPKKTFSGWDKDSLAKLPPAASSLFQFVLSKQEGITMELHNRIVEARVAGSSLHALRRELVRNRYNRMYETIAAYYRHCEMHQQSRESSSIVSYLRPSSDTE